MSKSSAIGIPLSGKTLPTEYQQGRETVGHGVARKPAKRAKSPTVKHAEDARAAQWFDAGVAAYPSAASYETEGSIDKGDLSKMRSGGIAVALRRLLPMLGHAPSALAFCEAFLSEVEVGEYPDDVLALVAPLLDAIHYCARPVHAMTRPQMAEALMADMEAEPMGRKLIEQSGERRGLTPGQVAMALRNNGESE